MKRYSGPSIRQMRVRSAVPEPFPLRRQRWGRLVLPVVAALTLVGVGLSLAGGAVGATAADWLRATIGPGRTAQVEAVYLNVADLWQQAQFHSGMKRVQAPWSVAAAAADPRTRFPGVHVSTLPAAGLSLPAALRPIVLPALWGEGVWTQSVAPVSGSGGTPLISKAFYRPDVARPYAVATILRLDLRHLALHLVAGVTEPGSSLGMRGTGIIPPADRVPNRLLAVFNGGFKYADGTYGMMVNHTVYVPPVSGAATVALTASGKVLMGAWGADRRLSLRNGSLVSWRQNGSLLIDHGVVNPAAADNGAWGTTVLNASYTWRSAIGMTDGHTLLYVAGNSLSVATLARTLRAAGAVTAMQMDINPFWVRAFLYGRDPAGQLTSVVLRPDMQGNPADYLVGMSRDFVYVTRAG